MHKGSLFSTSLPVLVTFCVFDGSHSNRCEVTSHCDLALHFPGDLVLLNFLKMYLLTTYMSSFEIYIPNNIDMSESNM